MLKERARLVASVLLAIDLVAVAAAFLLAYWLRDSALPALGLRPRHLYPLHLYLPLLPLVLGIWGLLLSWLGTYRSHRTIRLIDEAWSVVRVTGLGAVLLVLCIYLFRLDAALLGDDDISRVWIVMLALGSALMILGGRTAVRLLSRFVRSSRRVSSPLCCLPSDHSSSCRARTSAYSTSALCLRCCRASSRYCNRRPPTSDCSGV